MFIRIVHKHRLRAGMIALLLLFTAGILLRYPTALANGVSRGLSICGTVIIPTLYPFMLFAGLLTDSPLCTRPSRLSATVTHRLFRLPACCGPAILLGLVGGYPAAALAIGRLQSNGQITAQQARRMSLFCVNGGPGFIVSTVGAGLLGSARAGWMLFAAHVITSLAMGVVLGHTEQKYAAESTPFHTPIAPRPFACVVQDTCAALLSMCGFVLLAAAGLSVWEASGLPLVLQSVTGLPASQWSAAIAGITEVSCGCIAFAGSGRFAPFWLCLCLGWGGLSVQGQLAVALAGKTAKSPVLTPTFWCARLLHGCTSGGLAMVLFRFIPANLPTASQPTTTPFYTSFPASIMLLIFSFMAMLCFYPKKTGNSV